MKEEIRNMIQKVVQGKHLEAQESFSKVFSQKALEKVQILKTDTAREFFNKDQE